MTTSDPREALDRIKARTAEATPGPWFAFDDTIGAEVKTCTCGGGIPGFGHEQYCGIDGPLITSAAPPDAVFIAHARTDIDRLTEALEAVLGAHEPFELSWGYGPVEFCKQCSDQGVPQEQAEWPCPTVRAITHALTEEEA